MRKEKFRHGDVVQIADDLGPSMEHFTKGKRAIVIGSYRDQYGGSSESNAKDYTLFVEGEGRTSWYQEHQLTKIGHNPELLDTWEDQIEAKRRNESSLKWIREHWKEIRKDPNSTTILALFRAIDFHSAFESNGEYCCLFSDWDHTYHFFDYMLTHSLDELRAAQKPDADPKQVDLTERNWRALWKE